MRRFLMLLAASATMLVVLATSAMAQEYPPTPQPAEQLVPGTAPAAGARGAGELAFTGSDLLPLIWIGLAVLVVGTALVVAARRRKAIRGRRVSEAIA
ncbi:MAG: LPXTG cell wall anchor domain-containing protein [Acidimicrobiia bacterium]